MVLYDMDILIAVATGLGKREEDASGSEYYLKDPECLGEHYLSWLPYISCCSEKLLTGMCPMVANATHQFYDERSGH